MLWLLALSHAGYLAFKLTPRPTTQTASAPQAAGTVAPGRGWTVNAAAPVSLRDGPGPAFAETSKLQPGTAVIVLSTEAGWALVTTAAGGVPQGYVLLGYLKPAA